MRMKTPQRVLAIVGGAFLLGTGQALIMDPIVLGPVNLTPGTEGAKGGPARVTMPKIESDPVVDPPEVIDPIITAPEQSDEPVDASEYTRNPSATYSGSPLDALLDAPVPVGTLTLREARKLWEDGMYFIDARHDFEFEAGHIQYAALLPAQMFDSDIEHANRVMDSIPLDGTIVLYCVGGDCDASKNTAALLEQYGYQDLRIMGAGYEHWVAAGFETSTGLDSQGVVSP